MELKINKNSAVAYYLSSFSNFISAFGGGLILGKGIGVISLPYLHEGSLLAFFVGTILGLAFLQFIPKRLSSRVSHSFSLCCAATSGILWCIYTNYSNSASLIGTPALAFFILLSIRFSFWFYSRVNRVSRVSSQQQSIAWVEFGYYLGMILGLVIWKLTNIFIALNAALIIDACFQFVAGVLDFQVHRILSNTVNKTEQKTQLENNKETSQYSVFGCYRLSVAVIFLTIGIQVVLFNLSHYVSEFLSPYILATFYCGVALAAFVCNQYKIVISWSDERYLPNINVKYLEINLLLIVCSSALSIIAVIYVLKFNQMDIIYPDPFRDTVICLFVLIAAFGYEICAIVLLDRLGYEENQINGSGMIMKTYGLMGLGAAITFWILGLTHTPFKSSIFVLIVSLVISAAVLMRKNYSNLMVEKAADKLSTS